MAKGESTDSIAMLTEAPLSRYVLGEDEFDTSDTGDAPWLSLNHVTPLWWLGNRLSLFNFFFNGKSSSFVALVALVEVLLGWGEGDFGGDSSGAAEAIVPASSASSRTCGIL